MSGPTGGSGNGQGPGIDTSNACVSASRGVTVTTTIDHEVGNVLKCVKAGFTRIAVVALTDEKLKKLTSAVQNSLGVEKSKAVGFFHPHAFIDSLRERRALIQSPAQPETRSRGGRTVKRTFTALSPEEAKAKEVTAHRLMAETMKKKARRE